SGAWVRYTGLVAVRWYVNSIRRSSLRGVIVIKDSKIYRYGVGHSVTSPKPSVTFAEGAARDAGRTLGATTTRDKDGFGGTLHVGVTVVKDKTRHCLRTDADCRRARRRCRAAGVAFRENDRRPGHVRLDRRRAHQSEVVRLARPAFQLAGR